MQNLAEFLDQCVSGGSHRQPMGRGEAVPEGYDGVPGTKELPRDHAAFGETLSIAIAVA